METVKELAKILEECDCKHSVEHCDTCPYIGEEGCLSYFETAKKLVEHGVTIATDTNAGDKWVSVDERLPITEKEALEYYEMNSEFPQFIVKIDVGVTAAVLEFNGKDWFDGYATYNVTHWQPLPAPPKEVQ